MQLAAEPDLSTPQSAGAGMRIAVIDSGVFPRHPHIGRIAGGVSVRAGAEPDEDPAAWIDRLGHGTAVTAAIQEKAPGAEVYAVRVFHEALRTSAATLLRAIDWCVEQRMDLVNLSLGATNPIHAPAFASAVIRATEAGTLLVAAREADGTPCYPGALPGVLSVGLDWDCPRDRFRCETRDDETIWYASGYPRPIPGTPPMRNLHGISFAVANMTGQAARILGEIDRAERPEAVQAALMAQAI